MRARDLDGRADVIAFASQATLLGFGAFTTLAAFASVATQACGENLA